MPKFDTYPEINALAPEDTLLAWQKETGRVRQVPVSVTRDNGSVADPLHPEVTVARGSTAQLGAYTGPSAELTVDTSKKVVVVQDGVTPGGNPLARQFDVNAKELGAKGDDSTNDYAALQAAINAAGPGGICRIPAGIYRISQVLTVPDHCRVVGAGIGKTFVNQTTALTGTFIIDSVQRSSIEDMSFIGQSASVISIKCTTADNFYTILRNIDIQSLGSAGIGIELVGAAGKFIGFTYMENIIISGGPINSWGTKIGIKIGTDNGTVIAVRTGIKGCRIFRTNTGILLDNCDTTMVSQLALDDIKGVCLDFNRGAASFFDWVAFEHDGVPAKYINFGSNSSDNTVYGYLANVTPAQLTDSGTRNAWIGSDGSGGQRSRLSGPTDHKGAFRLRDKGTLSDVIVGTDGAPALAAGASADFQTWTVGVGDMTNVTSIAQCESFFQQGGGWVDWNLRMQFRATVASTVVTIKIPIMPHLQAYRQFGSINAMQFVGYAFGAGSAHLPVYVKFPHNGDASGHVTISVPTGNWFTAANDNQLYFHIRYKAVNYTS